MFLVASLSGRAANPRYADALAPIARVQRVVLLQDVALDDGSFEDELGHVLGPDRVAHLVLSGTAPHSVEAIRALLDAGRTVVCEVDAGADVDLTASQLAEALRADALLLLDGELRIRDRDHGLIEHADTTQLLAMDLPGPARRKVAAACHFTDTTGRPALIGTLRTADDRLRGITVTKGAVPSAS